VDLVCLPDTVDPRGPEGEVSDTDARLWHPWLRINRLQRVMLHTRWSTEAWAEVRVAFTKALARRSQIRRASWWFIHENASKRCEGTDSGARSGWRR
jgi:hypothetical protein